MDKQSYDTNSAAPSQPSDRWAEIMLAIACILTVAWIGFTAWLAAEVLGLF